MENFPMVFKLDGQIEGNTLVGNAAAQGNLDRTGDVLFPGCWKGAIGKAFIETGFVPVGHAWDELPVAMPMKAKEQGAFLAVEAQFHSTQAAQDAMTVCKERFAAGKSIGLSVGFRCAKDGYAFFENGDALLKCAADMGCDMSLFDSKAIKAWSGWGLRGIWGVDELYEFSIVPVPANPMAQAFALKSISAKDDRPDGVSLSDHLELLVLAGREALQRASVVHSDRSQSPRGNTIGADSRAHLKALITELTKLDAEVEKTLAAPRDSAIAKQLLELQREALEIESAWLTQ